MKKPTRPQTTETIDGYIARFPASTRKILNVVRKAIKDSAPNAEEAIRYQIPTFRLRDKNLVHFAAYKNHLGFYPTSSGIRAFKNDISKYKTSKGTVQFPIHEPMPLAIIRAIVKFRVKEVTT